MKMDQDQQRETPWYEDKKISELYSYHKPCIRCVHTCNVRSEEKWEWTIQSTNEGPAVSCDFQRSSF